LAILKLIGNNHFGYLGFRYPFFTTFLGGTLSDNGAMNIVVNNLEKFILVYSSLYAFEYRSLFYEYMCMSN